MSSRLQTVYYKEALNGLRWSTANGDSGPVGAICIFGVAEQPTLVNIDYEKLYKLIEQTVDRNDNAFPYMTMKGEYKVRLAQAILNFDEGRGNRNDLEYIGMLGVALKIRVVEVKRLKIRL